VTTVHPPTDLLRCSFLGFGMKGHMVRLRLHQPGTLEAQRPAEVVVAFLRACESAQLFGKR
jgi:hypothetical protein